MLGRIQQKPQAPKSKVLMTEAKSFSYTRMCVLAKRLEALPTYPQLLLQNTLTWVM
jgi:hypothetical protein